MVKLMSLRRVLLGLLITAHTTMALAQALNVSVSTRPSEGRVPSVGAWFWSPDVFEDEGYRPYIDRFRDHSTFDLLTVSCRLPGREVTSPEVHDRLKAVLDYAGRFGRDVAFELDVRLARAAFHKAHPDELQEMLQLRTVDLAASGTVKLRLEAKALRDHMNSRTTPYLPMSNRLVRVYSFVRGAEGIVSGAVEDITEQRCTAKSIGAGAIEVTIACGPDMRNRTACVAAAFSLFTPDVFAPHLLEFQRSIVEQYADLKLAGLMKDEWGFPPCFDGCPKKNDFWYSEARAEAYAARTGGRDLVRDCLLMYLGEKGWETERLAAINHFRAMSRERNTQIEDHYYHLAKEFFGPDAYVVTHPTWMPYPGTAEFKKNGLHWWQARRDLAQTDESTPYCARTSLAKKWGSPVWVNQFYAKAAVPYERSVWSHALGGGRLNYHPLYPYKGDRYGDLLRCKVMRAEARVRLLNFISKSPVYCPVAVLFGHTCAMNWAGPAYDDVGLVLTDQLWRKGYYADLIPTSEIGQGTLTVSEDGYIQYGPQRYEAVVLYHPEFENPETAALFKKAADGATSLFCVGGWTRNFQAEPFDGHAVLPDTVIRVEDAAACGTRVIEELQARGVVAHSAATSMTTCWRKDMITAAPPRKGHLRLLDGTQIVLSGQDQAEGDPLRTDCGFGDTQVTINAVGVAALRLDAEGAVEAFAAGGLKELCAPGIHIELPVRLDVAFWREAGRSYGVYQGSLTQVPEALKTLTKDWTRLDLPSLLP